MKEPSAKVLECTVIPAWEAAVFGSVTSGTLVIRGKLMSASKESEEVWKTWDFYFDRESYRSIEDKYYLLLDHNNRHMHDGSYDHTALVLCSEGPENFRRIGMINHVDGSR